MHLKMIAERQVHAILSQLGVLQDFQTQIENLQGYISKVVQKGTSWLEETDNNKSFIEITQLLAKETAECITQFLAIPNGSEVLTHGNDTSEPTVHVNQATGLTPPKSSFKDDKEYQSLVQKIEAMEKSMLSQTKSIKVLKKKQADNEQRKDETDKEHNVKTEEILKELHAASEFMSRLQTQNETLLNQVEKNVQELKSLKAQSLDGEEKADIFKNQQKLLENSFTLKFDEVKKDISGTTDNINKIKTQCKKLTTQINANETKIESVKTSLDKLQNNEQKLKENELKIQQLEKCKNDIETNSLITLDRINIKIQATDQHYSTLESEIKSLYSKVEDVKKEMKDTTLLIDPLKKDLTDISSKLSQLQTLNDRFVKQNGKWYALDKKMTTLNNKIVDVERSIPSGEKVFFSAHVSHAMNVEMSLTKDQIVTSFAYVICNEGNHYDTSKGIFTAPFDGLYFCSLTLKCEVGENVSFKIAAKQSNGTIRCKCYALTSDAASNASVVSPVKLSKNDELFLISNENYPLIKLNRFSFFMCALISKF